MSAPSSAQSDLPLGGSGRVHVAVLGPLTVRDATDHRFDADAFRTAKTRHVLRLLALAQGRPIRTDVLVEHLWPDTSQDRGRSSLRTSLALIRRAVGTPALLRAGDAVLLQDVEVDATMFLGLAHQAHAALAQGRVEVGLTVTSRALALYRGDLAAADPPNELLARESERFTLIRHELLLEAAKAAVQLGHDDDGLEFARAALDRDPCSERACRLAMHAYVRLGERPMALRTYERCRVAVRDELGVDLTRATRELHAAILRDDDPRTLAVPVDRPVPATASPSVLVATPPALVRT